MSEQKQRCPGSWVIEPLIWFVVLFVPFGIIALIAYAHRLEAAHAASKQPEKPS